MLQHPAEHSSGFSLPSDKTFDRIKLEMSVEITIRSANYTGASVFIASDTGGCSCPQLGTRILIIVRTGCQMSDRPHLSIVKRHFVIHLTRQSANYSPKSTERDSRWRETGGRGY